MNHHTEIADVLSHREAVDALTKAAWEAGRTESVKVALRALLMAERGEPSFTFDRSRHGAAARVAQVLDRMRTAEAVFDPEAQR